MGKGSMAAETTSHLTARLYAALRHTPGCSCGECSGGLNAVDEMERRILAAEARVTSLEAEVVRLRAVLLLIETDTDDLGYETPAAIVARASLAEEEVTPDSRDASGGAPVSRDARHPRSDTTALAAPTALPPPRNPGQNEYGGGALAALAKEDTDE